MKVDVKGVNYTVETKEQYKQRVAHLEDDLHNLEAYMEAFTSFLPLAVCVVNADGIIVDMNEAFNDFTGYENETAVGVPLKQFFIEENELLELLKAAKETPRGKIQKKLILTTQKSRRQTVRVTVSSRQDNAGDHTGYFIGINETFSLKQTPPAPTPESSVTAEEDLVHEQQKIQAVIDSMHDGVLIIDETGRISGLNTQAADIFDLDKEETVGTLVADLKRTPKIVPLVKKIETKAGEKEALEIGKRTLETTIHKTTAKAGDIYYLVTLHDVSQNELVEDLKLTFVSVAAHQIRTPLSSIRWSFEILAKGLENNKEYQKIARRGYRSTKNMLEIVNELLNLDRLQSGKDSYNFDAVDVVGLIENYVKEVEESKQIIKQPEITFEAPVDPLPKVRADKEKLRIVIRNVIDNALKYTKSDGNVHVVTSVHVTDDYSNDMIQISVTDTGIGIPPEAQGKIFSKFYRADNARLTETDGTGIGLFISKQIIEEHNGVIWFESTEGEGTTFYIQLPISQDQD